MPQGVAEDAPFCSDHPWSGGLISPFASEHCWMNQVALASIGGLGVCMLHPDRSYDKPKER